MKRIECRRQKDQLAGDETIFKPIFDRLSPAAVRVSHRTAKFVCIGTVSILTADTTVGAPLAVRRGLKNRVRRCYSWENTLSKTTTIIVDVFGR